MPTNSIVATLASATQQLSQLASARLEAEALLCHVLKKNRAYLRTWPERALSPQQATHFNALLQRRQQGEPLAYIAGKKEFWSLELSITPATLIPRSDTELLVEQALARIPIDATWQIADLGTGSGAIGLALAHERPHCNITATDISSDALNVAQHNAKQLGLSNIQHQQGEWCRALANKQYHLIAANPPYVDADDPHLQADGLPFEPRTALSPGPDGLSAIRILCRQAKHHLQSPGWLLLEHGHRQGEQVRALLEQESYNKIKTYQDLSGNERMTIGQWCKS